MMKRQIITSIFLFYMLLFSCKPTDNNNLQSGKDWNEYLGGPGRNHYSTLSQIDTSNVSKLKVAWIYNTRDSGEMQCNSIIVNGILFGMTAKTFPFAIDAASGKEIWRAKDTAKFVRYNMSRGITYWEDGKDKRIFYTKGSWLYALDALNGKLISSFGEQGRTSLKAGLGESAKDKFVVSTSPGTIYKDLIIMPLRVSEGSDAAIGRIQAFDTRSGELKWVFYTIPWSYEYGYDTWPKDAYKNTDIGGVNNWAGMAIDRERGIVYIPTGSAAFDYFGGNRKGSNLFANCLLALDAETGHRLWHYQLVHHDILDRDLPAPPNLITITQNGKKIDAVAQVTKHGQVFVFDRVTGKPLFPVEEREIPTSTVPGEQAWPTQPFPVKPLPYVRQTLTESDLSPYAENKAELLDLFRKSRSGNPFTPLSFEGTLVFPGLDGGAEWGGAAVDPEGILYVNSNEMAWLLALGVAESDEKDDGVLSGKNVYFNSCVACHGAERKGNPQMNITSLVDIQKRRSESFAMNIISGGKAMMPAFTMLSENQKKAVIDYIFGKEETRQGSAKNKLTKEPGLGNNPNNSKVPYKVSLFSKFLDSKGLPAISPPWGTLNAINLNTGEYVWKIPFGEYPELAEKGIKGTGAESYGGPVITAGGLLFIAGTKDRKFRAYNKRTGHLIWETHLPAAGFATPSTYEVNGKQYIVIACGGVKLGATPGDSYVAFALP
ncbi:MAG TPA: PQQ-binding-like beta-propeller repeat protein [Prolixibacteraceae bacterium]|nr:PQQ-binding-like beta-propeller repeat protein [Prolixibacteraceae bacterium]